MSRDHDPTGPSLDDEGVPDLEGPLPEKALTGDAQEGVPPPASRPAALDWGVTAEEQRAGEPVSVRVERERPDLDVPGALADPMERGFVVVDDADADVDTLDTEKDAVGRLVDAPDLGLGPEEAAMHVVDDPDATYTSDPDAAGPDPDGLGPLDDGYVSERS
jgi:hypothetical protein